MAYFHCLIGGGSSGGGYELTVTCDADFAGTTITCTDGVTTLTQTCPSASPYEVVFEIPNGGDWTISGVVSGQTVTTGVNIPTTAELIAFIPQSITIYSAKEDTVTYTDIHGDTQTEVFASGQSSKQITVDIEPNGSSITFTSGVAKDPINLSNAYSKTVTITSNTTDVYLMPDDALYWWGYDSGNIENASGIQLGMSYISYTTNINSISMTPSSGSFSGVINKNQLSSGKKISTIIETFTGGSDGGISIWYTSTKSARPTAPDLIYNVNQNTLNTKQKYDYTSTQAGYFSVLTANPKSGAVYAMWYE